jgi:hypothetical protein
MISNVVLAATRVVGNEYTSQSTPHVHPVRPTGGANKTFPDPIPTNICHRDLGVPPPTPPITLGPPLNTPKSY